MQTNWVLVAVGVAVGYVAGQLILGVSTGLITPLIGAVINRDNFVNSSFTINGNQVQYGYLLGLAIGVALVLALVSRRSRA
jgi:large-conductance mechanosensitive channel